MTTNADIVNLYPAQHVATLPSLLKAVADDSRLQILRVMVKDSFNVSELCEIFGARQNALSHHLKILIEAGLLSRKREGTSTFYHRALASGTLAAFQKHLESVIDTEPLLDTTKKGVTRVQKLRENNSATFFKNNAKLFRDQQELIAPWRDYSNITLQLIDRCKDSQSPRIVDIGVGEGWLIPELARRGTEVFALDLSQEMLNLAERFAGTLPRVRFIKGSTDTLITTGVTAEVAIANMVLHHTPRPEKMLIEAAQILTVGGALIVSELCAHDQAWAREHCGDLWLGFTPEQLEEWAIKAGFKRVASVFLAQRNGFQIQVQHFERC